MAFISAPLHFSTRTFYFMHYHHHYNCSILLLLLLHCLSLGLLGLYGKITIKIERAFSVIFRALLITRDSFQLSLQPPAVAVPSGNSPSFVSKCQTGKLFTSHQRSSGLCSDCMVQLYYYSNIFKVKPIEFLKNF